MARWLLILGFLAALSSAEDAEGAEGECAAGEACDTGLKATGRQPRVHFWPSARGHAGSYSTTQVVLPANLSSAFSWKYFDLGGQYNSIALGCLIDDQKNIYLSGHDAITKLDQDGKVVWSHRKQNRTVPTMPFLLDDALFGSSHSGDVFALDLNTGRELWSKNVSREIGGDTAFLTGHDGTIIAAVECAETHERNAKVLALNATDGQVLWEYSPEAAVWNFMGLFPLDGTLVFQDLEGRAYRISLADGTLIWRRGGNPGTWTDGTLMLGPNKLVYAVTTHGPMLHCAEQFSKKWVCSGAILAYRLSDGEEVWRQNFSMPANAFPAVGSVAGLPGLTVVVPVGQQAGFALVLIGPFIVVVLLGGFSVGCSGLCCLSTCCCRCSFDLKTRRRSWRGFMLGLITGGLLLIPVFKKPVYEASLVALDAETGQERWTYQLPPWTQFHTAGDPEGLSTRLKAGTRPICVPNPFSAPTITGDGAVHVGYQDGRIFSVRDADGDGKINPESEVFTFSTGTAFSSPGAAYAPGMLAVANCDGVYVFKG